ncbi:josephin-like protein [Dendroctonus ponderosae]|uniref:Josephin-2 n=1 Tax=Dendroctonus ponderosae TaxID=77166 RepID=J3JW92_DENPD
MNPAKVVYHEKQVRELCALHALNNLFQEKGAFSKSELDSICYNLSPENWINPHKSVLGLGNYDVNVIMRALQIRNYEMIWFDKRKDPSSIQLENVTGFILNVPTDYKFSFITIPLKRRHWIAVKLLNGLYYNLDSKLEHPVAIGNEEDLLNFLRTELDSQDKELFVITTSDSAKLSSWLKQQSDYNNKIVDSSNRDAEEVLLCNINPRTAVGK